MAEKKGKTKKLSVTDVGSVTAGQDTLQRAMAYARENPLIVGAAAGAVVLILLAGWLFRVNASITDDEIMTRYAKALENEDPAAQVTELEAVVQEGGRWTAEVLYMLGEAAIRAQQYDKSAEAFKRVTEEFGTSEYAPRAAEGLAFLEENKGNTDAALSGYKDVMDKWSNTFTGRCQWYNIARVQESKGDFKAAVEAYQAQVKGFPDSHISEKSEEALARLKKEHADLFPEEAQEGEASVTVLEGQSEGVVSEGENTPSAEGETTGSGQS
ncbi:MAG TPA: tetratricopeptide repeat protein [Candidatus Hydrogenedentes bacterium]|nr:tetratricopeptide repeat protein [Candidatus Hydrogenedentota bacterium]